MSRATERGISLIELIVFIVIVSTAVMGVLGVLGVATRSSADPLVQKQALAIAEALLEEIQLQPFTYCDPDDANAATAQSAAACTNDENQLPLGAEAGETRSGAVTPFDNVSDYNGYAMPAGITDIAGNAVPGLGNYQASVSVANQAFGGVPASDALRITVTVNGPGNTTVVLDGYRVRYAPNALP